MVGPGNRKDSCYWTAGPAFPWTGTAFYCGGRGGGPQAVTGLTQCIRDTLGLGKYNFDLGKRGYMKFLPRPD